jgi:hypothetical protein
LHSTDADAVSKILLAASAVGILCGAFLFFGLARVIHLLYAIYARMGERESVPPTSGTLG